MTPLSLLAALRVPPAERRLLAEARLASPMPWILAIMMFLGVLAAAAGLIMSRAAEQLDAAVAGRLTVQVVQADPAARDREAAAAIAALRRVAGVGEVRRVPDGRIAALLEPYFGAAGLGGEVPVPALIDATFDRDSPGVAARARAALARVAPSARIDSHAQWLAPMRSLIGLLSLLASALITMMLVAVGATVVLAARAVLNTHRDTIEILHLMGTTDHQVARLFQRRIAIDALIGGLVGGGAAILVGIVIGTQIAALGQGLLSVDMLGWADWPLLLALPLGAALLSLLMARWTVLRALRVTP